LGPSIGESIYLFLLNQLILAAFISQHTSLDQTVSPLPVNLLPSLSDALHQCAIIFCGCSWCFDFSVSVYHFTDL